ncbi:DDE_3 domain-containing protein [Trichonephila clavipes]|nr:DDE_3 domain-containing protein [Trichonephila clavipes]
MTGHIYRDVILEQHVRLFRGAMGAQFLFMDDNARPHRANIVDECLLSEDINRMDWPAYSSDLNPIEHVWDKLDRRIAARQPPPTDLPELRRALLDEWCNIPQDQIDNLILSMPRRWNYRHPPPFSRLRASLLFFPLNGQNSPQQRPLSSLSCDMRQASKCAMCESFTQVTVRFCSVPPQFRGRKPWGWLGASHLSSPSANHTRGLAARWLCRIPPMPQTHYTFFQTSMSSPGFEPSPYGIAVSVANH